MYLCSVDIFTSPKMYTAACTAYHMQISKIMVWVGGQKNKWTWPTRGCYYLIFEIYLTGT